MKPMRILSLFDGMSCGQIALRELGIPIDCYYASEIDRFAIAQTQFNFPKTIQLGDVKTVDVSKICEDGAIDMLIGGSPCQSFSFAGKRAGMKSTENEEIYTLERYLQLKRQGFEFEGQSYLFWEYMRILKELRRYNPNVLFLLENVVMCKKWERVLSEAIGIRGVHINSALVSAQNRRRIYWTNIRVGYSGLFGEPYSDIPQPADRGILLRDILEKDVDEKYFLSDKVANHILDRKAYNHEKGYRFGALIHSGGGKMSSIRLGGKSEYDLVYVNDHIQNNLTDSNGKAKSFLATIGKDAWENGMSLIVQRGHGYNQGGVFSEKLSTLTSHAFEYNNHVLSGFRIRRITPTERARLQTIPDWYVWECSENQQHRMLGNGWTVEVIKHIFSFLERDELLNDESAAPCYERGNRS